MEIKKTFLTGLVVSLVISAIIAISMFLFGSFGSVEWKILVTALIIGGYSLTGLSSSALFYKQGYKIFAYVGIGIALLGLCINILSIWGSFLIHEIWHTICTLDIWQIHFIFPILSVAIAHSSLLLLAKSNNGFIGHVIEITILSIAFVSALIILLLFDTTNRNGYNEYLYRFLGVFAVLAVLGTILIPLLNKLIVNKNGGIK